MLVYLNGDYMPKEEARISPEDRGFLFADGAYEVFHAYEGRLIRRIGTNHRKVLGVFSKGAEGGRILPVDKGVSR